MLKVDELWGVTVWGLGIGRAIHDSDTISIIFWIIILRPFTKNIPPCSPLKNKGEIGAVLDGDV
jgi:hypothetical protein